MQDFPVIKIQLEGIAKQVGMSIIAHNDSINKMVIESLEKQLTADAVQAQIDEQVQKCIQGAISQLSNHWQMREVITDLIANVVAAKFSENS